MRKHIKVLFVLSASIYLFGCTHNEVENNTDVDKFNNAVEYNYSSFDIEITTSKDKTSLRSKYEITKHEDSYLITYSVQDYNKFDLDSGTAPEEMITTKTGTFVSNEAKYNITKFKFSKDHFKAYTFSKDCFSGTIENAKNYLATDYDCLNFEIVFKYSEKLSEIKMNYSLSDSTSCLVLFNNFK